MRAFTTEWASQVLPFKKVGASDIKLTPTWQGQSTAGHIHNFLITLGESPNSFLNALLKFEIEEYPEFCAISEIVSLEVLS